MAQIKSLSSLTYHRSAKHIKPYCQRNCCIFLIESSEVLFICKCALYYHRNGCFSCCFFIVTKALRNVYSFITVQRTTFIMQSYITALSVVFAHISKVSDVKSKLFEEKPRHCKNKNSKVVGNLECDSGSE